MPKANMQAHIPKRELRDFDRLLSELMTKSKKSAPRIVRTAAVRFCQTNANTAPKSKKRRKVVKNPQYDPKAARKERYTEQDIFSGALTKKNRYQIFRSTGRKWWEYTNERSAKNVPGTKIKQQGALKNSWRSMIGDIMNKPGKLVGNSKGTRGWRKAAKAERNFKGRNPNAVLTNRMRYIFEVTPQADWIGLDGAQKDVMRQLDKLTDNWRKSWRR